MRPALADGYHQVIPATGASACSRTSVSRSPTSTATRSSNRRPTPHPAWPPAFTTQLSPAGFGAAVLYYGGAALFVAAWLVGAAVVWLLWRPASSAFFKRQGFTQALPRQV
jgi:hypothetical protein